MQRGWEPPRGRMSPFHHKNPKIGSDSLPHLPWRCHGAHHEARRPKLQCPVSIRILSDPTRVSQVLTAPHLPPHTPRAHRKAFTSPPGCGFHPHGTGSGSGLILPPAPHGDKDTSMLSRGCHHLPGAPDVPRAFQCARELLGLWRNHKFPPCAKIHLQFLISGNKRHLLPTVAGLEALIYGRTARRPISSKIASSH